MTFVFAAFMAIWLGIFAYIVYWQRQVHDLRAEVRALRQLAARSLPGSE